MLLDPKGENQVVLPRGEPPSASLSCPLPPRSRPSSPTRGCGRARWPQACPEFPIWEPVGVRPVPSPTLDSLGTPSPPGRPPPGPLITRWV